MSIEKLISLRQQIIKKDFSRMNDMQLEAVLSTKGPLLVLAGAGSGKTTVLVNRIVNLVKYGEAYYSSDFSRPIREGDEALLENYLAGDTSLFEAEDLLSVRPAKPWQILAITFTNKAAGELKERICKALGEDGNDVWASTFHSTCAKILRRHADEIGYTHNFTIYDSDDSKRAAKECIKRLGYDEKMIPVKSVLAEISRAKDELITPAEFISTNQADIRLKKIGEVYEEYQKFLKAADAMDFDDLIVNMVKLLKTNKETREYYQNRFKYIMVDEYQDTNHAQYVLTALLAAGHENICVVGDDDQSIYRFRLADPTLFMDKYRTFSRDAEARQRCIDLGRNFRSVPLVLDAVNDVFSRVMTMDAAGMDYGEREKLYAGRTAPEDSSWLGGPPEVDLVDTSGDNEGLTAFEQEARFVASRIRELLESGKMAARKDGTLEPLSYRHIVILVRSMKNKADKLIEALQERGIPSYAEQRGGYFAAVEVQVMLALLRCIDNPEQDLPMAAVLRSPLVGLDETALAELRLMGDETLWQNLPAFSDSLDEADPLKEDIDDFISHFEEWRTYSRRQGVAELIQRLYADTAYVDFVGAMPGGDLRQANLKALYDRAQQYEDAGFRGLFRYLQLIDKMMEDGLDLAPAKVVSEKEDVVRIMSIHQSKGLEFPVVIVADMGKEFNRKDLQEPILFHNELGIGLKQYDSTWRMFYPTLIWSGIEAKLRWEGTAEEERVLYVAMTRARDQLILIGHDSKAADHWARWADGLDPAQGNSYFDWVMPTVAAYFGNQVNAETIRAGAFWQGDRWQLHIVSSEAAPGLTEEVLAGEPRLEALRRGDMTDTPIPDWLDRQLSWQYAFPKAVTTAAKFSVSEVKRRYHELQSEELAEENGLALSPVTILPPEHEAQNPFDDLPPWLADEGDGVSGAQRGTALHKAMQYITPAADHTEGSLRRELATFVRRGIFSPEESSLIYVPVLASFWRSSLGRRMAASPELHREYPFTVLLAGGPLTEIEGGERFLIQGIIDCLFREDDGWVLVDYKSDRLEQDDDFKERYAVQLALYKQAVEQITGIPVRETYIYSFHLQREIMM